MRDAFSRTRCDTPWGGILFEVNMSDLKKFAKRDWKKMPVVLPATKTQALVREDYNGNWYQWVSSGLYVTAKPIQKAGGR